MASIRNHLLLIMTKNIEEAYEGAVELSFSRRMRWREINERIKECKSLSDPSQRIRCLIELFDETEDGMVALEIGREYRDQGVISGDLGLLEKAVKYFDEAAEKFPLEDFKSLAIREKNKTLHVIQKMREHDMTSKSNKLRELFSSSSISINHLNPQSTVIIVACSKRKIWDVSNGAPRFVPARFAYRGREFMEVVEWIENNELERKGFKWFILSAKYGFIEPWHPVCKYDVTFDDEMSGPISSLTLYYQVMRQVRWSEKGEKYYLKDFRNVICFGNESYMEKIREAFKDTDAEIIDGNSILEYRRFRSRLIS